MNTRDITNINQLANHIYTDQFFSGYCTKFTNGLEYDADDLLQEFVMAVLKMNQDKLFDLCKKNEFNYYAVAMIRNIVYNKNSEFNVQRREGRTADIGECAEPVSEDQESTYFDNEDTKELLDIIGNYLNHKVDGRYDLDNLSWYSKKLFGLYYTDYSNYDEMSKDLNIPRSSIAATVLRVTPKIRKKFQKQYDSLCLDAKTDSDLYSKDMSL